MVDATRRLILGAALGFATGASRAQSGPAPVSVAKVINFSCALCRASEAQDPIIRDAVRAQGGQFAYATMPTDATNYARELLYYAARDYGPDIERQVRESLYRGAQDRGLPLIDGAQLAVWLESDLAALRVDWSAVIRRALTERGPRESLGRAAMLVQRAGVQALPSYVLVQDGDIVAMLDAANANANNSWVVLRDAVIARVKQLSTPETNPRKP